MQRPFIFSLLRSFVCVCLRLRKMCVCANKFGSMSQWFMERKCVRSTKHTKDKRQSTNTRIDWFGCRVFWPSSILSEWLNEKKPSAKINITQPKFVISMAGDSVFAIQSKISQKRHPIFCLWSGKERKHFFELIFNKTFGNNTLAHIDLCSKNWIYSLYYYQIYINLWWWVCAPLLQWPTLIIHWNCILNINEESDLNNKRQWLINITRSWIPSSARDRNRTRCGSFLLLNI